MFQFAQILKIILGIFPSIIQAIKALEELFPQAGQGAVKLEVLKTVVQEASELADDLSVSFDQLWPAINNLVNGIVGIFNRTGLFK